MPSGEAALVLCNAQCLTRLITLPLDKRPLDRNARRNSYLAVFLALVKLSTTYPLRLDIRQKLVEKFVDNRMDSPIWLNYTLLRHSLSRWHRLFLLVSCLRVCFCHAELIKEGTD